MTARRMTAEIAAMELVEAALELPAAERVEYIARVPKPLGIRQLALRLLSRADSPDDIAAPSPSAVP